MAAACARSMSAAPAWATARVAFASSNLPKNPLPGSPVSFALFGVSFAYQDPDVVDLRCLMRRRDLGLHEDTSSRRVAFAPPLWSWILDFPVEIVTQSSDNNVHPDVARGPFHDVLTACWGPARMHPLSPLLLCLVRDTQFKRLAVRVQVQAVMVCCYC